MKAQNVSLALLAVICLLSSATAFAQVTTEVTIDEEGNYIIASLATEFDDLAVSISDSDLINGFGVNDDDTCSGGNCTLGLPINQAISESAISPFGSWTPGYIDPYNGIDLDPAFPGIGSWYMTSGPSAPCRSMLYAQNSSGFYQGGLPAGKVNGDLPDLVDGQAGDAFKSILRDYARASLVVRYGFETPTDIGRIRIFAANLEEPGNAGRMGRVFQYYDVYARQGDCSSGSCPAGPNEWDGFDQFFLVAQGVASGTPGQTSNYPGDNPNPWEGTMTDVINFNGDILVEDCTDLRIVMYCVSNAGGFFIDPYQSYQWDDPGVGDTCSNGYPEETGWDEDGYMKAFEAPIIKEIDVFGPIDTPWGDIDYDGDLDLDDFGRFQYCFGGDVTADGCYRYDYNEDDVIGLDDFLLMEPNITGPQ